MKFGIWKFDADFGLVGTPNNLPEHYLTVEKLWETEDTALGQVWKWPVQLARNAWFDPGVADDFNKAFFYAQEFHENKRPFNTPKSFEFDARTVQLQAEILNDYFHGTEEEVSLR